MSLTEYFKNKTLDEELSYSIAAVETLMQALRNDKSTTLQEFIGKMSIYREELIHSQSTHVAVKAGCELFVRFITMAQRGLEQEGDFKKCREILLARGDKFIREMLEKRQKVVDNSNRLIKDDMVILVHSRSRNVLAALLKAHKDEKQFHVYVTESQPKCEGRRMVKDLECAGISCTLILDVAVAYIMDKVDIVMVGAEGVCGNGGIINRLGFYGVATLAHEKNKPVYVLVESFKFIRTIPLGNSCLPKEYLYPSEVLQTCKDLTCFHPLVDYTPPKYITLLYTDLGILPTSAVIEYLLKLYL